MSSFEVDAFDSPLMKPLLIGESRVGPASGVFKENLRLMWTHVGSRYVADVEHSYQRPDAPSDSRSVLMDPKAGGCISSFDASPCPEI